MKEDWLSIEYLHLKSCATKSLHRVAGLETHGYTGVVGCPI